MILEGIVTTLNTDDSVNVSPMGPIVTPEMTHFVLRPFQTSQTYKNLKRTREGVFHVVDDAELLAHAAVSKTAPPMAPTTVVTGRYLTDACRFYEFRITDVDDAEERTTLKAEVVHHQRLRDFFGFNRARHAVLEAAILATRVHILDSSAISEQLASLKTLVEKTGSDAEHRAFSFLEEHIASASERIEQESQGTNHE